MRAGAAPGSPSRRPYLDVLRGIAVLVMIEAHVIDSWTRDADRQLHYYRQSIVLGGFAAPLFLFVAGIGVAMSASSKARRLGDEHAAARMVRNRGLQIFALAFLFRLQSLVLSNGEAWTLLKVDILNIMGLTIAACALLWTAVHGARARAALFAAVSGVLVFTSPFVRSLPALARLPDPIEGYIRPIPGLTNFSLFPWAAFVTAGAVIGVVLDAARTPAADRRANVWIGLGGAALAFAAWRASFLPPVDPRSAFWSTSASFFFIRLGVMVAGLGAVYLWEQRPSVLRLPGRPEQRFSPVQTLGRSSLFVYWIHVEMVYGLVSLPLHRAFSLAGAWLALGVFTLFILACVVLKNRLVNWWKGSPLTPRRAFIYAGSSAGGVKP